MIGSERLVAIVASALAIAAPAAIALQGSEWWIIALTFVGTAAGVVVGRLALSKPEDTRYIDALTAGEHIPLAHRRIPE